MIEKENRGGARTGAGRPKVEKKILTRNKGFSARFTQKELEKIENVLKKIEGKNKSDKLLVIFEYFEKKDCI